MIKIGNHKSLNKNFFISVIIIFILGSISHFLYDLTNNSIIIGSIFPVNESIWEHLKLLLLPVILWWITFYLIGKNKYNLNKDRWFISSIISLLFSMIFQNSMYYLYACGFGIKSIIFDILLFLISIIIGQSIGLHYYRHGKEVNYKISLLILFFIVLFFIFLTFNTPNLPIFKDSITGTYGI